MISSKKISGGVVEICKSFIKKVQGKYQKVRICHVVGVHPKSIYKKTAETVMGHYLMQSDDEIFELIKPIIKARPTYGYKRVTAMLNRQRVELGLDKYNKKRVYRIMKMRGVILPKQGKSRDVKKTGVVMTLHSNTRWCSDGLEIKCFNGEKVYVAFILDCCDREVITFIARLRPLLAEDIQELMLAAVEKRFSNYRAERQIEFLSDRGSIYKAYNVQNLARQLNLKSYFTAPYSPESNGMSEAFVNTLKRDYVYTNACDTAENVIRMLKGWFADYNEIAPHSALGMKSPMGYRLVTNSG